MVDLYELDTIAAESPCAAVVTGADDQDLPDAVVHGCLDCVVEAQGPRRQVRQGRAAEVSEKRDPESTPNDPPRQAQHHHGEGIIDNAEVCQMGACEGDVLGG